jgi:hypothetical protein
MNKNPFKEDNKVLIINEGLTDRYYSLTSGMKAMIGDGKVHIINYIDGERVTLKGDSYNWHYTSLGPVEEQDKDNQI